MNEITLAAKEEIVIMLNCQLCKNWVHSNCIGFNFEDLKSYFKNFTSFFCIDCYFKDKAQDRFNELTVNYH